MKIILTSGYTFTPASSTLDFGAYAGFDVKRLLGVLNATAGKILYAPGLQGLGYTAINGAVLMLAANTAGMNASDQLVVIYDDPTANSRPPLTYAKAAGSPFTLTTAWQKVVTTTAATRGLRIAPVASTSVYDIEWVSVVAGATAPTDTYGEPVLGGEDFPAGPPIGDIYLKSASGQLALVKTGV